MSVAIFVGAALFLGDPKPSVYDPEPVGEPHFLERRRGTGLRVLYRFGETFSWGRRFSREFVSGSSGVVGFTRPKTDDTRPACLQRRFQTWRTSVQLQAGVSIRSSVHRASTSKSLSL